MDIVLATRTATAENLSSGYRETVMATFILRFLRILRNQEEECDRLAGVLYTKGLTQEQVGDVFDEIYGQHYSKLTVSAKQ